jgi:hypothetical protein
MNLIENGGQAILKKSQQKFSELINIEPNVEEIFVVFSIKDNGCGMVQKVQVKVQVKLPGWVCLAPNKQQKTLLIGFIFSGLMFY